MLYDHELEMELDREFGLDSFGPDRFERDFEDDKASDSVAAGRMATRRLHAEFRSACQGRRILKRLRKTPLSPDEEIAMLQKRIAGLPQLFQGLAALKRQAPRLNETDYWSAYAKLMTALGYDPREYLGTLAEAITQAKCELSHAKLVAYAECDGMEVDDPQSIATQAADWYAQTELKLRQTVANVTCPDDRGCDVSYSNGVTLHVSFEKVPDALVVLPVPPTLGPVRHYSYSCFHRHLNLSTIPQPK